MLPINITEEKHYSFSALSNKFKCSIDELDDILNKLNRRNIINFTYKNSDEYVKFVFVGVLIIENYVINCYPKYIEEYEFNDLKQIIKVLERLQRDDEVVHFQNTFNNDKSINLLPILLFLMKDYYENDLYKNFQEIMEINGDGEILWDRTINNNKVFIQNNKPYYYEVFTRNRINDLNDYFRRLHKIILTECSQKLEDCNLLNLFDLTEIYLTDETLDNFDNTETILNNINYELHTQFDTRKLEVLESMRLYIENKSSNFGLKNCFSLYGTTSFAHVWEKVCCYVFNDLKDTPLRNISLPCELKEEYSNSLDLMSLIEKPLWNFFENEPIYKNTLKPDLITTYQSDNIFAFCIFDAKYYNIIGRQNEEMRNFPGIESITKQYLYHLAFKKFIENHKFDCMFNCFLFPSPFLNVQKIGYVELEMLNRIGLKNIEIILLPPKNLYKSFLERNNDVLINKIFSILSRSYEED